MVSWDDDREGDLAASKVRATELLKQNWPWVEAVAKALIVRKTLQRQDLLDLKPSDK
jgi:hypothetical protein